jgi:riboflavin kinase/FMN adenylyltransferase
MKLTGKVVRGKQEGTKIGFPTANIRTGKSSDPGIYAGYADLDDGSLINRKAIFYISQDNSSVVECHILDFPKKDLYGDEITVEILHKLREVQEFSSLEEARAQIKKDELEAREWFSNRKK